MTEKQLEKRLRFLAGLVLAACIVLIGRLWLVQVVQGSDFAAKAEANAIRLIPTTAPRGVIYDRNGRPLVTSRAGFTISVIPEQMRRDRADKTIRFLARTLGVDEAKIRSDIAASSATPFYPVRVKRNADVRDVTIISENLVDLPGVIVEKQPLRYYPYGEIGAQLFGYLGQISDKELRLWRDKDYKPGDIVGKTGLEREFEPYLRGTDGGQQVEVNAVNKPIRVLGTVDPVPGNDLVLTIDAKVQLAAEKALDEALVQMQQAGYKRARSGAVVALDPRTGAILAMVSKPEFDPNKFVGGVTVDYWNQLLNNQARPFQNRVLQAALPPGSTFKAVTATAALEEGKVTKSEIIHDNGYDPVYPQKKDWTLAWGFILGDVDIVKAIQMSSDVFFYEMGRRVGIDRLSEWARRFGLEQPTGVNLFPGEVRGVVPDRKWKREYFKRPDDKIWYPIETLDVAIGQGALQVTPLQLADVYAAIANGGAVYTPYVIQRVQAPDGKALEQFTPKKLRTVPISPQTEAILKEGLGTVTKKGTGATAFRGFPLAAAGKTGTAELYENSKENHAWFAGFAPLEAPEIVVVALVENSGEGGQAAAPIARKVMDAYFGFTKPDPKQPGDSKPGASQPASSQSGRA